MLNYFQYQFNYPNDMTAVTVQRTREITEKFVRVRSESEKISRLKRGKAVKSRVWYTVENELLKLNVAL